MTTRILKIKADIDLLFDYIKGLKLPLTVNIKKGKDRSIEQNKLAFKWYLEAGEQGDMTAPEYRAYCKLHYGVPILRLENEEYKNLYDKHFRNISYEDKLEIMQSEQFDFPVTRQMTTMQMKLYLDDIWHFFDDKGFILTDPKDRVE